MITVDGIYSGMDVSSYQGVIDWDQVGNSGIEFVMIRAGYRTTVDRYFARNMDRAHGAGIRRGLYLYSYAPNSSSSKAEADFVIELAKSYGTGFPIAYDMESNDILNKLTNAQRSDNAVTFLEAVRAAGYYPLLYSNRYWLQNMFDSRIDPYDKWVAVWGVDSPDYDGNLAMWQYTSTGSVDGISGNVDLDITYKDYWTTGGDEMTLEQAVQELEAKGVINTPNYWLNASKCVKYLDLLLINAAEAIEDKNKIQ